MQLSYGVDCGTSGAQSVGCEINGGEPAVEPLAFDLASVVRRSRIAYDTIPRQRVGAGSLE